MPDQWYKVVLTRAQIGRNVQSEIYRRFTSIFIPSRTWPDEVALFEKRNEGVDSYTIYFSPEAVRYAPDILNVYSGEPCDKPDASEAVVALGGGSAARLLS